MKTKLNRSVSLCREFNTIHLQFSSWSCSFELYLSNAVSFKMSTWPTHNSHSILQSSTSTICFSCFSSSKRLQCDNTVSLTFLSKRSESTKCKFHWQPNIYQ